MAQPRCARLRVRMVFPQNGMRGRAGASKLRASGLLYSEALPIGLFNNMYTTARIHQERALLFGDTNTNTLEGLLRFSVAYFQRAVFIATTPTTGVRRLVLLAI